MEAATHLFAEKGYGSTSVRELVEAAGVTKPTLYYYFDNKEALFLEIVHGHIEGLEQLVQMVVQSPGSVQERLRQFARLYVSGAEENKDAVKLLMTVKSPEGDQPKVDLMSMHLAAIQHLTVLFEEGIASGELRSTIDPQASVMAFIGTVNLLCAACVQGMPVTPDSPDKAVDIIFFGVGA